MVKKITPQLNEAQSKRFDAMNGNCDGAYGTGKFPPEVKAHLATEIALAVKKERERCIQKIINHAQEVKWDERALKNVLEVLESEK